MRQILRCIFTLIGLSIFLSFSQLNARNIVQITGKVIAEQDGKPIYLASVTLLNSQISNVTSSEGIFTLKIPQDRVTDKDSIVVSYLGYSTETVSVKDLVNAKHQPYSIVLKSVIFELDAATMMGSGILIIHV